jgi:hypothetical protein
MTTDAMRTEATAWLDRQLSSHGMPVGSCSGEPPFDWEQPATWAPAVQGVRAVYVSYYSDVALPGAVESVRSLAGLAVKHGVRRLMLLSGRGEDEAERRAGCTGIGAEWTLAAGEPR